MTPDSRPPSDMIARLNAALDGRYEVEKQIGEGGMATVFLAQDSSTIARSPSRS